MTSLRFITSYRSVLKIGKCFGLSLPWSRETPTMKTVHLCWEILIQLFLFYKLMCALLAYQIYPNFEENVFGSAVSIFQAFGFLTSLFYLLRRDGFDEILSNMDLLSQDFKDSGLGVKEFFIDLYNLDASRVSKFALFLTPCTIMCPFMFCASVPVTGLLYGNYGERLPVYNRCPFETMDSGAYEYLVMQQFLGFLLPAFQKLGHECIMLGLFRVQSAYFKALSSALTVLSEGIEANSNVVSAKMRKWIQLHQASLRNADVLIKFFSPVIIMYYICIISCVAGGVFYQLNAKDANFMQANFLGMYMFITMLYMYVQCHAADEVSSKAQHLAIDAYIMPWYKINLRERGLIRMIINRANRPLIVMSYKCPSFTLSKEAYQAFCMNTISAYMGFSKVMNEMQD